MPTFEEYQGTIARVYDQNKNVIGAGLLVAPQYLLTCAHVVSQALGLETTDFLRQELTVDFPGKTGIIKATVTLWRPYSEPQLINVKPGEDIALLKLEEKINLQPIPIKALETVHGLAFNIWGFPEKDGKETNGTIRALQRSSQWYQLQVAQDMPPIEGGFSGSPLWHPDHGIIGMTVAVNSDHNPETNIGGREARAIAGSELYEIWHKQGELIAILEGVPWSIVRDSYQFARHHYCPTQWKTEMPETLAKASADLYEMQRTSNQNHQLAFVSHLLNRGKLTSDVLVDLTNWAKKHFPDDFEAVKQEIHQKIQSQVSSESRLWIILKSGATSDHYFLESAHFIENLEAYQSGTAPDKTFTLDSCEISKTKLNENIAPILTAIRQQIPSTITDLIVEVFLPFKALDLEPDQWLLKDKYEDESSPLGIEFPVVLRILERIETDYLQHGIWRQKWQNKRLAPVSQEVLICTTCNASEIIQALDAFTKSGLHSPYPPSEHLTKPKPHSLVMKHGIPFWLWVRKPLGSCEQAEVFEEELLKKVSLGGLPQRLKQLRNDALNNPNHLAAHISFLADNPEKIPNLETIPFQNP
ncbi:MAG: trypsin-like peptidase domain-containing protein [Cyanobacteriota bacterium]|jgi:hypothetical protein